LKVLIPKKNNQNLRGNEMETVMKFNGELLVDERFKDVLQENFDTAQKQEAFLTKALNNAINTEYPNEMFSLKIEVIE